MGAGAQIQPGARVLRPGTRLGRYVLHRKLARGGMAEVYIARALGADGFEKVVALKLVLPHLSDDERFIEMFRAEAKLAAQLDHPNIVQVTDFGSANGEYFLAMEFVHGETVRSLLAAGMDKGGVPLEAGLTVVHSACAGLHYAHELAPAGIIHRDVSPSNLMVRYDGSVKLVDFGIAKAATATKATRTGTLKGKGGYMSPEQCRGEPLDRRSDVFGLGILLYEVTTGRRLFFGDNDFAVMNRIVDGDFVAPSEAFEGYPVDLEPIVLKALQVDPADRHQSAQELQLELEAFAAAAGLKLTPVRLAEHVRGLFGSPAFPDPKLPPEPTEKGSPKWIWVGALSVAAAGIAAAFFFAGDAPEVAAADEPSPSPPVERPVADPTPPPPPQAQAEDLPEAPKARPRPRKPKRGRKAKSQRAGKKSNPDAFFPRGMDD